MKHFTIIALCLVMALVGGCNKNSSKLDHPFDMEALYGLTSKELRDKLGPPSDTTNSRGSTLYVWESGDILFMAAYSDKGEALVFDFSDLGPTVHTYETLQEKFNINAKDDRYRVTYSAPDDKTGSVQIAHVKFYWRR